MPCFNWREFVHLLAAQENIKSEFKVVQLVQAILESGRGTSDLFLRYGNPYGMKYREAMEKVATSALYTASDGADLYCSFPSLENAVAGYWVFLGRKVYAGYEQCEDAIALLKHLVSCGYAGSSKVAQEAYIRKCVQLFPETRHILRVV